MSFSAKQLERPSSHYNQYNNTHMEHVVTQIYYYFQFHYFILFFK